MDYCKVNVVCNDIERLGLNILNLADFLHEHGITYDDIAKFCLEGTLSAALGSILIDAVY